MASEDTGRQMAQTAAAVIQGLNNPEAEKEFKETAKQVTKDVMGPARKKLVEKAKEGGIQLL